MKKKLFSEDKNGGNMQGFITTNGLKVRLNQEFFIKYTNPDRINNWLLSVEAFTTLSSILSIIFAYYSIIKGLNIQSSITGIWMSYSIGYAISQSLLGITITIMPVMLLYSIYNIVSRLFLQYIGLIIIAFITKNFLLLGIFIGTRIIIGIITLIVYYFISKFHLRKYGFAMGDVEIVAYLTHLCFCNNNELQLDTWKQKYGEFIHNDISA